MDGERKTGVFISFFSLGQLVRLGLIHFEHFMVVAALWVMALCAHGFGFSFLLLPLGVLLGGHVPFLSGIYEKSGVL